MEQKAVSPAMSGSSKPKEMIFRFLPTGQVVWYSAKGQEYMDKGYLGNHVVFSIVDWIARKVASAPPILYEVKDEKEHKRYKNLLKEATPESVFTASMMKHKALEEVDGGEMMNLFERPNEIMPWFEFVYGHTVYKIINGSSYWGAVRDGINSRSEGKIREMWLYPAGDVEIVSGGIMKPIEGYRLQTAPDVTIEAANVMQIRNFSPDYNTPTQWMYGLSKLHAARYILQEYNEATEVKVDMFQKRGVRDIVFPKMQNWEEEAVEQAMKVQDDINKKIMQSGQGGVIANSVELGTIRVGLSPVELGILENQNLTRKDFCALLHVPAVLFDWSDRSTYNNLSESRKIALTDAVIPELEALKDGLNNWLIPSWYPEQSGIGKKRRRLLDFDYEYFPEMQADVTKTVEWMDKADCLTTNEKRAAIRYDASPDENSDKIVVSNSKKLLENVGIDSFEGDTNSWDEEEEKQ